MFSSRAADVLEQLQVALGTLGCFPTFDDLLTLTVRAADGDERHGPFLPQEAIQMRPSVTFLSVHLHF